MSEVPLQCDGCAKTEPRLGPHNLYTGTSLTRKRTPLGPYRRPMPRVLEGS